jgi:hypothetical protein
MCADLLAIDRFGRVGAYSTLVFGVSKMISYSCGIALAPLWRGKGFVFSWCAASDSWNSLLVKS